MEECFDLRNLYNNKNMIRNKRGHIMLDWSDNIREKIVQFWFILGKDMGTEINTLETRFREIMSILTRNLCSIYAVEINDSKELLPLMFKLLFHIRSPYTGLGNRKISYMMLKVWYDYYPLASIYALEQFLTGDKFGCWRDVKGLCNYLKYDCKYSENHPIIINCCLLMNRQIEKDMESLTDKYYTYAGAGAGADNNNHIISNVAKWVPREKSNNGKNDWLFTMLSQFYFREYIFHAKTYESYIRSIRKTKMDYRKLCSSLNSYLGTLETIMSSGRVCDIKLSDLSSQNLLDYSSYFLKNDNKCDFTSFVEKEEYKIMKGAELNIGQFVTKAVKLIDNCSDHNVCERKMLNVMWNKYIEDIEMNDVVIPMLDVSISDKRQLYEAIGYCIIVSMKSKFGAGLVSFGTHGKWINLENCVENFVEMVETIINEINSDKTMKCNFYDGFRILASAMETAIITNYEMSKYKIIVFSTMDFDYSNNNNDNDMINNLLAENINTIFDNKKMDAKPGLILWNLGHVSVNNGFPSEVYNNKNILMISGQTKEYLNIIGGKKVYSGNKSSSQYSMINSYNFLENVLNRKCYSRIEKHFIDNYL